MVFYCILQRFQQIFRFCGKVNNFVDWINSGQLRGSREFLLTWKWHATVNTATLGLSGVVQTGFTTSLNFLLLTRLLTPIWPLTLWKGEGVLFVKKQPSWDRLIKKEWRNFSADDYFDLAVSIYLWATSLPFWLFFLGTWPITEKIPLQ